MSILSDLTSEFHSKLIAFAGGYSPDLPIGFSGIAFIHPTDRMWLEVISVVNEAEDLGMEAGANFTELGAFMVKCCIGTGLGGNPIIDLGEDLRSNFPKMTALGQGFVRETPSLSGVVKDDKNESLFVSVKIRWRVIR